MIFLIRKTFLLTREIIVKLWPIHANGDFTYNIKNDVIYKPTKVSPRDIGTLKTHVMCHFENKVNLKNDNDGQEKKNYQGNCETRKHAISMRIAWLCYVGYIIG